MKNELRQFGFSLIEVLMAVGILAVGLLLVAGTFPVGIHLTAVSTERTLGAVAADEAFAKIQLYGSQVNWPAHSVASTQASYDFNDIFNSFATIDINAVEFEYPSTTDSQVVKNYSWSAMMRFVNINSPRQLQFTVFANRRVSNGLKYFEPDADSANYGYVVSNQGNIPKPVKLNIQTISSVPNRKQIEVNSSYWGSTSFSDYITDDSVIIDDETGNIYRIIDVDIENNIFYVDRDWHGSTLTGSFWVVPPPVGGGKSPCVGVYQRIINF